MNPIRKIPQAAAGAAALVALLTVLERPQPSAAKIIYTPTNQVLEGDGQLQFDINNDGIPDFTLNQEVSGSQACLFGLVTVTPSQGNAVAGVHTASGTYWASAIASGGQIGPTRRFFSSQSLLTQFDTGPFCIEGGYVYGYWFNGHANYLGVTFQQGGKTHYGWAELTVALVQGFRLNLETTLMGYAYETIPGKPISAGATMGRSNPFAALVIRR